MSDQLHPDLHRLQQQYLQLVQAVNDQSMSLDDAMATLAALKVFDGAGTEWSYSPAGQLLRAQPGQAGQPAEPWEFTPPQLPPHASDPGLQFPSPGQFGGPGAFGGPGGFGAPGAPDQFGGHGAPGQAPWPQTPGDGGYPPATGGAGYPGQFDGGFGQTPAGYAPMQGGGQRSLPANMAPGQRKARPAAVDMVVGLVRTHGKLIGVGVLCAALLLFGLGRLRGGSDSPTIADVPVTPPAPIEVPIIPAPTPVQPGEGGEAAGEQDAAEEAALAAPDGDTVVALLAALRSADAELLARQVVNANSPLSARLLAAQLVGLNQVGLDLAADAAAPDGEGRAVQTWRVVDLNTGETLNRLTVSWVRESDGAWRIVSVPPLG